MITETAVRREGSRIIVPLGGEETVLGVERATRLRDELTAALGSDTDDLARIATLESALSALIARVRRTGGYASPEEQDVLRAAEQALAGGALGTQTSGGAENRSSFPQERAEEPECTQTAPQASALTACIPMTSTVCDYECRGAAAEDRGP